MNASSVLHWQVFYSVNLISLGVTTYCKVDKTKRLKKSEKTIPDANLNKNSETRIMCQALDV